MLKTLLPLAVWLFCFGTNSNGQSNVSNFKITGVLKGLGDKKILLANKGKGYGGGFVIRYYDSVVSKRDTFYFEGHVSEPQFYSIEISGESTWLPILMENSQILVTGSADSIWKSKIRGSSEHAAYSKFNDSLYFPSVRALSVIRQKRDAARAMGRIDEAERLADSLGFENKRLVEKTLQFIKTYPNKFVSLDKLYDLLPVIPVDTAKLYFESLSEHLWAHSLAKKLNTRLFAFSELLKVNAKVPNFSLPDADGRVSNIAVYRGRYVLLDFWASWCVPCLEEVPAIKDFYSQHSPSVEVVGISLDSDKDKWISAVEKHKIPWPTWSDLKGSENEVAQMFAIRFIPFKLLIDPVGRIVLINPTMDEVVKFFEELTSS